MQQLKKEKDFTSDFAEKIFAVVNPVSANGKTEKVWPKLKKYFIRNDVDIYPVKTKYPEHAEILVREALQNGYINIMSVGGDGTVNEVVNGFFQNGKMINPDSRLIVFSSGTGSDFIKSLGISNKPGKMVKLIKQGKEKMVDIGLVNYHKNNGKKTTRYFVNLSDAGIGGETVARVNDSSKFYGGMLTYLLGALKTLVSYKNKHFKLKIDKKVVVNRKINSIMIGNGSYFAGGMEIAPKAEVDNGLLNIVVLGDLNKIEIITNLYKAYKGTHLSYPKIESYKGKEIFIEAKEEVLLNIDGESAGKLPAYFKILPARLPVMVL